MSERMDVHAITLHDHHPHAYITLSLTALVALTSGLEFSASVLWVRRSNVVLTVAENATLAGLPEVFKAERPDCNGSIASEFNWQNWCAMLQVKKQPRV